ncbi:MAG: hypothetical protein QXI33_03305 [Candidatus Pacearchaeota archaeon]
MNFSYDIIGNIVIAKFPKNVKKSDKIKLAKKFLSEKKNAKTFLEKADKVKGRLRTIKTNFLAGDKNLIAYYIENGCRFKFNVETCYFSPRLSNERKEIAEQVKNGEKVLVMFSGVAPFPIVIAKNSKAKKIYGIEINRIASKYAEDNVKLNKINNIEIIQGDVKKIIPELMKEKIKFDRIVMPRPQLKDTFLFYSFKVIKDNGIINYYDFSKEKEEIIKKIELESKKSRKRIKIIKVKKAGEIAPYKYRWRVDFKVL